MIFFLYFLDFYIWVAERGSLSLPHEKIIVKERRRKENEGTNDREVDNKVSIFT